MSANSEKVAALSALLRHHKVVRLVVVCEQDGVVLPPEVKERGVVSLDIGLDMPVPIPDLAVDEEGISCTMSFGRVPFYCVVPWGSIAMVQVDQDEGRKPRRRLALVPADFAFDPAYQDPDPGLTSPPTLSLVR